MSEKDKAVSETELANAYEMLCLGCADERQQRVMAEDCKIESEENEKLRAKVKELEAIEQKYNELLMEVQNKVKGVSRHERALRIIRGAEALSGLADKCCSNSTERDAIK